MARIKLKKGATGYQKWEISRLLFSEWGFGCILDREDPSIMIVAQGPLASKVPIEASLNEEQAQEIGKVPGVLSVDLKGEGNILDT